MRQNISRKVHKIRLQKGDMVMVNSGKYKGKIGKVTATHPSLNQVTVEGINIIKRAFKPSRTRPQGGIVEITKPIWVGKVGLVDSTGKKVSKIGYKQTKDGGKTRIYKSTGKEIK